MTNIQNRINFSIASVPGGIEAQEAQGQQNFVNSSTLPIDGDWETLQRWGVVRGEPVDDMFCACTLPDGWQKVPTKHSMWSHLLDERGLIRASIFYKAAFYDRSAHFSPTTRFSIASVYQESEDPIYGKQCQVRDNALERSVFVDLPVYAGLHKNSLVAVYGELIYSMQGSFFKTPVLQIDKRINLNDVRLLTQSEFYGKWHNRERTEYPFIEAVAALAQVKCQEYFESLPKDDSIWGTAFDFPEVAV